MNRHLSKGEYSCFFGYDNSEILNLCYTCTNSIFSSLGKSMEEIKKLLLLVLGCAVQVNVIKGLKNIFVNLMLFLDWENPHEDHCYMNKCLAQDSSQSKSLVLDEWNDCRKGGSMGKGDTLYATICYQCLNQPQNMYCCNRVQEKALGSALGIKIVIGLFSHLWTTIDVFFYIWYKANK